MNTRKDYQRAAKIVQDIAKEDFTDDQQLSGVVEDAFVVFFQADNPRFDPDKFRKACCKGK